ncbi:MAG: histidine phosphatase family protein [Methylophaga sp.]
MLRLLYLYLVLLTLPVQAADLSVLTQPGHALLLRHAQAPGIGDPAGFQLEQCNTQRNLSEQGRRQARQIGDKLRAAGIESATVYSSRWCRCLETAELLGFSAPQTLPAIDSFFRSRDADAKKVATEAFQQHLVTDHDKKARIYITHQVNLSALLGGFAASGDGYLVSVSEQGNINIISEFSLQ